MFTSTFFPPRFFAPTFFPERGTPAGPALDLLEALQAYLDADATLVAAFGGAGQESFWADQAPAGTRLPYLVVDGYLEHDSYESPAGDATRPYTGEGDLLVSVYAATKGQARTLGFATLDALNDAPLTFTRGTLLWFRGHAPGDATVDPEPGPDGADVWRHTILVRFLIARTI